MHSSSGVSNYTRLKKFSNNQGASLFGVADISQIKEDFQLSGSLKEKVKYAVSIGVSLSALVLSEIEDAPTRLYYHHYRTANMFLDRIAFGMSGFIQEKGFSALPIPASQITDWNKQSAHLSHKKIGVLAGVGWIGRNNLLVSREFGSQFRLATVLTDMPLKTDKPSEFGCGLCRRCLEACPVSAIKDDPVDFDHIGCFEKLKSFQKQNIVGQFICGVCVKACAPRHK